MFLLRGWAGRFEVTQKCELASLILYLLRHYFQWVEPRVHIICVSDQKAKLFIASSQLSNRALAMCHQIIRQQHESTRPALSNGIGQI